MSKERKHKTHAPELTAEDIKFAQLLFAARTQPGDRKTVVQCYVEAGFPEHGTSDGTRGAAYRRVKNREFRQFYRVLQDSAAASAQITPNIITRALARIALFDVREVFDGRGRIKLPCEWSDAVASGVLAVESEELFEWEEQRDPETGLKVRRKVLVGYSRKVKRCPPTEALKVLAQVLRMIGQDADAGKTGQAAAKNAAVIEIELGPEHVEPPADAAGG